jgi:diaminohydroxyphosphoribosylaminopyrimidine deaminase/5-amino-6-(5-phosphoribosylamino)uracil reductase
MVNTISNASYANADQDVYFMRQALTLAESALYVPSPNPRVGCLIVRDGQVLGRGATLAVGQAHAEVVALENVISQGGTTLGATIYISLEPCSHHGKTPPCVDAIILAKPARVVFAHFDPNPKVAGRGMRALREAGIDVTIGVLADEALALNPGFVSRMTRGVPYVWLKIAASLDSQTALANGESQWITQQPARDDGHHWRARSCMVMTGIGTIKTDNPMMNVRAVSTKRQPKLAIVDPRFEVLETARVFAGLQDQPARSIVIFVASDPTLQPEKFQNLTQQGVEIIRVADTKPPYRIDIDAMMRWLGAHEINELHVEAGAGLNGAIWQAGLVDELLLYLAPSFLGLGKPMLDMPGIDTLDQATRLIFAEVAPIGGDIRARARHAERWEALRASLHLIDAH